MNANDDDDDDEDSDDDDEDDNGMAAEAASDSASDDDDDDDSDANRRGPGSGGASSSGSPSGLLPPSAHGSARPVNGARVRMEDTVLGSDRMRHLPSDWNIDHSRMQYLTATGATASYTTTRRGRVGRWRGLRTPPRPLPSRPRYVCLAS